jgi:ankyrin repeat protein
LLLHIIFKDSFRDGFNNIAKIGLYLGFDPNTEYVNGVPVLHIAALKGNLELVKILIDSGVDINGVTKKYTVIHNDPPADYDEWRSGPWEGDDYLTNGINPLHAAAIGGDTEVMQFLIKKGISIEDKAKCNKTPLVSAVSNGRFEAVRLLLELGADPLTKVGLGNRISDISVMFVNDDFWPMITKAVAKAEKEVQAKINEVVKDIDNSNNPIDLLANLKKLCRYDDIEALNAIQKILMNEEKMGMLDNQTYIKIVDSPLYQFMNYFVKTVPADKALEFFLKLAESNSFFSKDKNQHSRNIIWFLTVLKIYGLNDDTIAFIGNHILSDGGYKYYALYALSELKGKQAQDELLRIIHLKKGNREFTKIRDIVSNLFRNMEDKAIIFYEELLMYQVNKEKGVYRNFIKPDFKLIPDKDISIFKSQIGTALEVLKRNEIDKEIIENFEEFKKYLQ